ncbi:MAG TPA: queuosine salvage family protein [Terriglobales bacterium]|nr:queuosine salvage family protein [Terriglobales bacterium]
MVALPLARSLAPIKQPRSVPGTDNRNAASQLRWPQPIGSPVLDSLRPVIENSRDVHTNVAKIGEHAGWMAYEELPLPEFGLPFGIGDNPRQAIDFILVADAIDFAFTDFSTNIKFQVDFAGKHWSDSDAMFGCLKRALDENIPILDGKFLSRVTRAELERIFRGNIEMPMLDERVAIFHEVGGVLASRYDGHFYNFVKSASPRVYDNGRGLVDKLVAEFPRFNDVSTYDGKQIKIYKLPQLGVWMLYSALHAKGGFQLQDPEKMTAFADYIVPAALRVMDILQYSPGLEETINQHRMVPRDSTQEIEIRAHTLYATALLREEVNKRRPSDMQVIIPQIDARLWTHYHTTFWPHHLTRTIMY